MAIQGVLSSDGQSMTIRVEGGFDFTKAKAFRACYANNELPERLQEYVVDLGETHHLDSSALAMLLSMRKFLGVSTSIKISNSRPQIKQILRISRFDEKFKID